MTMSSNYRSKTIRLWQILRSNRARLQGLAVVCLAAAGFCVSRETPSSARAATEHASTSGAESTFPVSDLATRRDEMTAQTDRAIAALNRTPERAQVPLTELGTNPFAGQDPPASSSTDTAMVRTRRESERQTVLRALQGLRLQSILSSNNHRACLINSSLFQEGQEIDGFKVEQITDKTVVVCRGLYRFELTAGR